MRKQWIVVAAAMMSIFLGVLRAAAQGLQGVGAAEAVQSSHGPHSYNPIKWMKKDSKTASEKPKKTKNKNLQRSL